MIFSRLTRATIARLVTWGTGNCPRCGAPLTAGGNCSQLCGGA